jgi:anaerobic magnesium-protoporphyrin IX monomethyl ester cyclase
MRNRRKISDENVDFLIKLNPDYAQFNILSLYPHTQVHKDALKLGFAEEGKWERFSLDPLNYKFKVEHWTEFMTEKELIDLQRKSYKRFYFQTKIYLEQFEENNHCARV